jgi:1-deoxy-D-xylulose-5-phosphate synthase
VEEVAGKLEESVKHMLTPGLIFEELGFRYVGPVDGHDVDQLVETFGRVKEMKGPILVHAITQKGKGFALAEDDPWTWHASGPSTRSPVKGRSRRGAAALSEGLRQGAHRAGRRRSARRRDHRRHAGRHSTGHVPEGASRPLLRRRHRRGARVTFAAGLATQGVKPIVAIYSTFLQRAYDNIVHDVALQGLPVVFGMDRAGIAGEDGPTHHGALDIAYMLAVPGMTVTAPKDGAEMLALLRLATQRADGPWSVRWPRAPSPPRCRTSPRSRTWSRSRGRS